MKKSGEGFDVKLTSPLLSLRLEHARLYYLNSRKPGSSWPSKSSVSSMQDKRHQGRGDSKRKTRENRTSQEALGERQMRVPVLTLKHLVKLQALLGSN